MHKTMQTVALGLLTFLWCSPLTAALAPLTSSPLLRIISTKISDSKDITAQQRSIVSIHGLHGTYSSFNPECKFLSPIAGPALYRTVENHTRYGNDGILTPFIRQLFNIGQDNLLYTTRHRGLPGSSLTPDMAAKLVASAVTGDVHDSKKQTELKDKLRSHHHAITGSKLKAETARQFIHSFTELAKPTSGNPSYMLPGIMSLALWLKYDHKADITNYMQELNKHIGCLKNPSWLKKIMFGQQDTIAFTADEIAQDKALIPYIPSAVTSLMADNRFERRIATLLHTQMTNSSLPVAVRNQYVTYLNQKSVADCSESSLRDLFSCLLNNKQNCDLSLLPAHIQPRKEFIDFFTTHKELTPETINSKTAAQAWMDIVSGHPTIQYCNRDAAHAEKSYEINPDIDNLLASINHLLNTSAGSFEELGQQLSHKDLSLHASRMGNTVTLKFKNETYAEPIIAHLAVNPGNHTSFDILERNDIEDEDVTELLKIEASSAHDMQSDTDEEIKLKMDLIVRSTVAGLSCLQIPWACSDAQEAKQLLFASRIPADKHWQLLHRLTEINDPTFMHSGPYIPALCELNANILDKPHERLSLLHRAISLPSIDLAQMILKHGANVDVRTEDPSSYTPLLRAVARSNQPLAAVKLLMHHGADINATDAFGHNALMLAIMRNKNSSETAEFLINQGINIHHLDSQGVNVLTYVRCTKNKAMEELLAKHGLTEEAIPKSTRVQSEHA